MLLILRLIFIALLSVSTLWALTLYGLPALAPVPAVTVTVTMMLGVLFSPFLPLLAEKFRRQKERGTVKWFNVTKGYGFITRDAGGDVFVHFRSIRGKGDARRSLNEGQIVEFTLTQGDKGPQAEQVSVIS